jgi:hypothetical protein
VSTVNSTLTSALVVFFCYTVLFDHVLYGRTIRLWIAWFAAYNVYDFASSCAVGAVVFRNEPGLIIHHSVVFSTFVASLYSDPDFMWYSVVAAICEFNSIFLNARTMIKVRSGCRLVPSF